MCDGGYVETVLAICHGIGQSLSGAERDQLGRQASYEVKRVAT